MSASTLQVLEAAFSTSDNERKVSCLSNLRTELESLHSPLELQSILGPLKAALESSNGHLTLAALACLTPLATHLASPNPQSQQSLKQLISTLYSSPTGSVIAFLGDSKERTRNAARSALCAVASASCEAHLKTPPTQITRSEEILQEIERIVKEHGFGNKAARARVQALYYLSETRARYPTVLHIKAYLPSLVSLLEDSDPSVRSAATESIVNIFSDLNLPASARGHLKTELAKQSIRRSTVDAILPRVFSASQHVPTADQTPQSLGKISLPDSGTLENPRCSHPDKIERDQDFNGSQPPSSALSRSVGPNGSEVQPPHSGIIHPVFVSSSRELEKILADMLPAWEGKETEHNWQARETNVNTIRGMVQTGAHAQYPSEFVVGVKSVSDGLLKSLASLRTTLAVGVCSALSDLTVLGPTLDPLVDIFLPPLLRMAAQTKKIVFQASQATAAAIIRTTSYHPRTLQYLLSCVNEKTVQARAAGITRIKEFVEVHGQRSRNQIETGGGLGFLEKALQKSLADASPDVRQTARDVFWTTAEIWPTISHSITQNLDQSIRKQLERSRPKGHTAASSILCKSEKQPSQRISVRSLIKSSRTVSNTSSNNNTENLTNPSSSPSLRKTSEQVKSTVKPISTAVTGSPDRSIKIQSAARSKIPSLTPPRATSRSISMVGPTHNFPHSPPRTAPSGKINNVLRRSLQTPPPSGSKLSGLRDRSTNSEPKVSLEYKLGRIDLSPNSRPIDLSYSPLRGAQLQKGDPMSSRVSGEENMVEDALKAQAEQAESAARRLLELAEDDGNESQSHPIPLGPGGVLIGQRTPSRTKTSDLSERNRTKLIASKQMASRMNWKLEFENSPIKLTGPNTQTDPAHLNLNDSKDSWWNKQAELLLSSVEVRDEEETMEGLIELMKSCEGDESKEIYLKLGRISEQRKCDGDEDEIQRKFWNKNLIFDKLFEGLRQKLLQEGISEEIRDCQLVLLRCLILYQGCLVSGKENELCEVLLNLASEGSANVIKAVEVIGGIWADISEPIYGLSCLRTSLEIFERRKQNQGIIDNDENWLGFTIRCLGQFFSRLPIEIVEEELPKSTELMKRALNHHQTEVRMSTVISLTMANSVLKDDTQIFKFLGNLSDSQEALLTYYLSSHHFPCSVIT